MLPLLASNIEVSMYKNPPAKSNKIDINSLKFNQGLHIQIWNYHVNQQDKILQVYTKNGPYQSVLLEYPKSRLVAHPRSFQFS